MTVAPLLIGLGVCWAGWGLTLALASWFQRQRDEALRERDELAGILRDCDAEAYADALRLVQHSSPETT